MRSLLAVFLLLQFFAIATGQDQRVFPGHDLVFQDLASTWDEAVPLGNGVIGNLVWLKNDRLRFSLDRSDLWDLRPMENIDFDEWTFQDVFEHWQRDEYEVVQEVFDVPYNQLPAPSKIPAGALEFDVADLGKVKTVTLNLEDAICTVEWETGTILRTFVHAEKPMGWYQFSGLSEPIDITLQSPAYDRPNEDGYTSQSRNDLNQLGYQQGEIVEGVNTLTYNQQGYGAFSYQIHTSWEEGENELVGCWSISSANEGWKSSPSAEEVVAQVRMSDVASSLKKHTAWWHQYWQQSSIRIPDSLLQRQYYLEMYKFGAVARPDAPPISLQAVWTADHGKLPPWKGDFHHDLNTQLSYWPSYAGNHLDLELGFIDWLWKHRSTFKKYTRDYFRVDGLNVPGVTTLAGEPMGGWIQYSLGQSVGAWLSHHFYLHWQFSQDRTFLRERAYPWLKEVSIFCQEVAVVEDGKRSLRMSSSPEIYNNSREAWFAETTNYDLALIRWNLEKTIELAQELGLDAEAEKWQRHLLEWPELTIDSSTGLMFAPGFPYNESHRHFSHLMAYHPLNSIDFSNGSRDQKVILNTLDQLEKIGPDYWTGYSYSWLGNLYARAFKGDKAGEALRTFAKCFCLKNSFHANGDQCKAGYSTMTYRPFTLEGNFAFAAAVQEMLIQSHTGIIQLFPAIPPDWKEVNFQHLRARGAFVISATRQEGWTKSVSIHAEKGGDLRIRNPFGSTGLQCSKDYTLEEGGVIIISTQPGERILMEAANSR
ncbi:MAG: hypothetical protein HKN87_08405 [Saprospiraceae bacterium]|nr:hypothetical protein [Saprospiraceae bacterium]